MAVQNEEVVCGSYHLGAVVRRSVASTVYEAAEGQAVIKTKDADIETSARRWSSAAKLDHPNLLRILDAGTCRIDGEDVAYVVMEKADESLAGVLRDRPLTIDELRQMLPSVAEALEYLHKNGYVHGSLKPSNVLAIGDDLKLSSDSVERAGSQPEDIRALGVLIMDALKSGSPEDAGVAEILRGCLDPNPQTRWTIGQIQTRLKGPLPEPKPEPTVIEIPRAQIAEWRAQKEEPEPLVADEPERKSRTPWWVFAGLAAIVLAVALFAMMRNKEPDHPTAPSQPVAQSPVVREREVTEAKPSPAPVAGGWSVIVAAYGKRESAEKRADRMSKRFSKFDISVFEQHSDRARFLVVLGHGLSEDQAQSLRERAIRAGLPRDTYIKRVM